MRRRPDFIIIGAMKCATSTLHDQLSVQPGLFMSTPKEPNFFSDDDVYGRGLGWYDGLFDGAAIGDRCGESSTHYTKRPLLGQTVRRMQEHLGPHTRFIYVMRDPVDRLVSQYIHEWTQRRIRCGINRAIQRHGELIAYSRYALQLTPYFDAFGPERILPVFFERLVAAPQEQLERICRFIGSDRTPTWSAEQTPSNISAARERRSAIRRVLSAVPGCRPLLHAMVPEAAWEGFKDRMWRMTARPALRPSVRADLEARLDEDLGRLGDWLGISITCATFKTAVDRPDVQWHHTHVQTLAS